MPWLAFRTQHWGRGIKSPPRLFGMRSLVSAMAYLLRAHSGQEPLYLVVILYPINICWLFWQSKTSFLGQVFFVSYLCCGCVSRGVFVQLNDIDDDDDDNDDDTPWQRRRSSYHFIPTVLFCICFEFCIRKASLRIEAVQRHFQCAIPKE